MLGGGSVPALPSGVGTRCGSPGSRSLRGLDSSRPILRSDLCALSQLLRFLTAKQDIPADLRIKGSFRGQRWRTRLLPAAHSCRGAVKTFARCVPSRLDLGTAVRSLVVRASAGSRFTRKLDSRVFLERLENRVTVSETENGNF